MTEPSVEDIATMRAEGSLREYFQFLTGRVPKQPKPAAAAPDKPALHIPRPGAWPCGTAPSAPSGPTPPPCSHQDTTP